MLSGSQREPGPHDPEPGGPYVRPGVVSPRRASASVRLVERRLGGGLAQDARLDQRAGHQPDPVLAWLGRKAGEVAVAGQEPPDYLAGPQRPPENRLGRPARLVVCRAAEAAARAGRPQRRAARRAGHAGRGPPHRREQRGEQRTGEADCRAHRRERPRRVLAARGRGRIQRPAQLRFGH